MRVMRCHAEKLLSQILPAAPPSFLQEIGVQMVDQKKPIVKAEANGDAMDVDAPEPAKAQGDLYIMGQTTKKFIARPDVSQLLLALAKKKVAEADLLLQAKKEEPKDDDPNELLAASDAPSTKGKKVIKGQGGSGTKAAAASPAKARPKPKAAPAAKT